MLEPEGDGQQLDRLFIAFESVLEEAAMLFDVAPLKEQLPF
jgi:hypothetical protein